MQTDNTEESQEDSQDNEEEEDAGGQMTGQLLDRWEILERIGEGGMSEVYKARHVIMNKIGAVKFLKADLSRDDKAILRFRQEAEASASLAHNNVIQVYDCGAAEQGFYLIMEFLQGSSLEDLLNDRGMDAEDGRGRLSMEEAMPIFLQVCDGLMHAHEKGLVHRDMKPSNIMLINKTGKSGETTVEYTEVKLVDFGIAKFVQSNAGREAHSLTKTGEVFGSPLYMSPEQCMGKPLDGRADMYSVGCLIYEALCGRKAFWGRNPTETMMKHVQEPPDLTAFDKIDEPWVPQMKAIIGQCLAKDPTQRFENMGQVKDALLEVPIHRKAPRAVRGEGFALSSGSRTFIVGLSIAALLLAGVMGLAIYTLFPVGKVQDRYLGLKAPAPALTFKMPVSTISAEEGKRILQKVATIPFVDKNATELSPQALKTTVEWMLTGALVRYEEARDNDKAGRKEVAAELYEKSGDLYSDTFERINEHDKANYDVVEVPNKSGDGQVKVALGNYNDQLKALSRGLYVYSVRNDLVNSMDSQNKEAESDLVEADHSLIDLLAGKGINLYAGRQELADAYLMRAIVLEKRKAYEEAAQSLEQSIAYSEEARGQTELDKDSALALGVKLANLAELYRIDEKFQAKEDPYDRAFAALSKGGYSDNAALARLHFHHGLYLLETESSDRFPKAFQEFSQAMPNLQGDERQACASYAYEAIKHYDWLGSITFRMQNRL